MMLALRTQIPHTVWAQDPQAAWTAAELLGWLERDEDQEVAANNELWRRTIQDDQRRPPANSAGPPAS